ncbi:MAG: glutaminyl-peptide cyclotransferase [Chitinophagaceae bacterium]|nr:MAG: glutaminyl-peptide cyclotransferase [Chitinophagaceae bacterium]
MKKILSATVILAFLIGTGCNNSETTNEATPSAPATPTITFSAVSQHAHDTSYFTEGLEFYKGKLIESTGLEGKSKLVIYDLSTGRVEKEIDLDPKSFGEGVTVFRDTVYQLTYRESKVNVYDVKDFRKIKELPFNGEGWGLTHDSTSLIATNGSNNLYYYEPGTFKLLKKIEVTEGGSPTTNLNELENINGFIYANQWQYNYILKINPANGEVVAKMDLSSIVNKEKSQNPNAEVLNGIAYNPETKKFYITGKNWSKIYELQLSL